MIPPVAPAVVEHGRSAEALVAPRGQGPAAERVAVLPAAPAASGFGEALLRVGPVDGVGRRSGGLGEAFEGATLSTFVAEILPPEDSEIWGGSAGRLWRGLFCEELAAHVARAGGFGIAEIVDRMIVDRQGDTA